jgi:hypothetical protein
MRQEFRGMPRKIPRTRGQKFRSFPSPPEEQSWRRGAPPTLQYLYEKPVPLLFESSRKNGIFAPSATKDDTFEKEG